MRTLALLVLLSVPLAGEETPDLETQLASMSWLTGTWEGPGFGGVFRAHYTSPASGKMLSISEVRKEGRITFHEFERFEVRTKHVVLTPFPGGRRAREFSLVKLEKQKATFENPKKDFPTRIVYERRDDSLVITLTDPFGESAQTMRFALKRVEE